MMERYGVVIIIGCVLYAMLLSPWLLFRWEMRKAALALNSRPDLAELLDRLSRDMSAVIADGRALREYGESLVNASPVLTTKGGDQALEVNAR